MAEYFAYTDGACSGNPGPGGWGALLMARDAAGAWAAAATLDLWPQDASEQAWRRTLRRDLLDGRVQAVPRSWPDLRIGDGEPRRLELRGQP